MSESWKGPEEDNMSIGELIDYLQALPASCKHLPVKVAQGEEVHNVNHSRLSFSNGVLYYSDGVMKTKSTFEGIYLEINMDKI